MCFARWSEAHRRVLHGTPPPAIRAVRSLLGDGAPERHRLAASPGNRDVEEKDIGRSSKDNVPPACRATGGVLVHPGAREGPGSSPASASEPPVGTGTSLCRELLS